MKSGVHSLIFFTLIYMLWGTLLSYTVWTGGATLLPHDLVWPAVLVLTLVPVLYYERRYLLIPGGIFKENADTLAVLAFFLVARFLMLTRVSVWLDEDVQANSVILRYAVDAGALQHQPPGDMIMTKLGLLYSNVQTWGLRLHSAVFSALAASLLYLLCKKVSGSRLLAFLSAGFFAFHFYSFRYGFEARPISHGLFMEMLFLYTLWLALADKAESREKQPVWLISAVTFLYLSSLGLQPVFVVGGALVYFAGLALFKRKFLRVFLGMLYGTFCFAPVQIAVLLTASPRFTKTSGFSPQLFFEGFQLRNFTPIESFVDPFGYFCIFGLIAAMLLFALKKVRFNLFLGFLVFNALFFIFTLIPFFTTHIEWGLNVYYLISVLPVFFLILACFWKTARDMVPNISNRIAMAMVLTVFGVASLRYHFPDRDIDFAREDMASAFRVIKQSMGPNDLVLSLCANESTVYCPPWAIGRAFYLPDPDITDSFRGSLDYYRKALKTGKKFENIYAIYFTIWSTYQPRSEYVIALLHKVAVLRFQVKDGNTARTMISVLEPMLKDGLDHNVLYVDIVEYLVVSYTYLQDWDMRVHYIKLYRDFPSAKTFSEYLEKRVAELKK